MPYIISIKQYMFVIFLFLDVSVLSKLLEI